MTKVSLPKATQSFRVGLGLGNLLVANVSLDARQLTVQHEGKQTVEDAEEHETVYVEDVGAETGEHRPNGKTGVAADGEGAEGLAFLVTG